MAVSPAVSKQKFVTSKTQRRMRRTSREEDDAMRLTVEKNSQNSALNVTMLTVSEQCTRWPITHVFIVNEFVKVEFHEKWKAFDNQ